ncbi:MAG: ATP-binding cassette domain-containing protein [Coriobacteriales bacterium]|jgi:ABC-2 type transport system ATP-binding protein|nr:ATP-binding cassette domain-containing protein [Coriobacteriales bacterium]
MSEIILKTTGLTKTYGQQHAVNQVNMTVHRGDVYGLVGQNGAGKTTLIRLVTGLTLPNSGEIELMGAHTASDLQHVRSRLGSIVESPALYPNLTATQNLETYRLQRGILERDCVARMLALVGLAGAGKKRFKDFSLGMKQRLGLGLALMSNPDFLILDEPINGLDPTGIVEIRDLIKRLSSEGVTILISSHILTELAQVSTRYGFIHEGKLLLEVTDRELAERCRRASHITVDDAAHAATVLEGQLGLRDFKVVSATEIRIYDQALQPAELARALFEHGIFVSGLQQLGDNLEEFFTELIDPRNHQVA